MEVDEPNVLEMVRAPFLFAIVVPLVVSAALSVNITGESDILGLIFAFVVGISLHVTTNIYNDIYDTFQGADTANSAENDFSGGSGILVDHPELEDNMFLLARSGIVGGFIGTLGLIFFSDTSLWPIYFFIFVTAAFLSKYYTAAPFKFAYRGLGEIVVVFGFGPLAVLLGTSSQGLVNDPAVYSIMPITGLSTLFIVWAGQMADLPSDVRAGKRGLVARFGIERSAYGLLSIHLMALVNVGIAANIIENGFILLLLLIPYILLLPKLYLEVKENPLDREKIKKATKLNFKLFLLFSFSLMASFILLVFV